MPAEFVTREQAAQHIKGKSVAIVGSGPGALLNAEGFIDSHDVVVRVNNYKLTPETGFRTDVFYSFFGTSVRKTKQELIHDGVKLCMCKCPNAQFMESDWHRQRGKMNGVDFRYIYQSRKSFWFCDTFIPTVDDFLVQFNLLGRHIPTTGFSAILDVLACEPSRVYLTGFDFFESAIHNVDEPWRRKNHDDPIGHAPQIEKAWIRNNMHKFPMTFDSTLRNAMG
jgi:hypothetical protein